LRVNLLRLEIFLGNQLELLLFSANIIFALTVYKKTDEIVIERDVTVSCEYVDVSILASLGGFPEGNFMAKA
jgi:hypothetical protein